MDKDKANAQIVVKNVSSILIPSRLWIPLVKVRKDLLEISQSGWGLIRGLIVTRPFKKYGCLLCSIKVNCATLEPYLKKNMPTFNAHRAAVYIVS